MLILACRGCRPPSLEGSLSWGSFSALHPLVMLCVVLAVAACTRALLRRRVEPLGAGLCPARVLLAALTTGLGAVLLWPYLTGEAVKTYNYSLAPWPRLTEVGTVSLGLFVLLLAYHARRPRLRPGTWGAIAGLTVVSTIAVAPGFVLYATWRGSSVRVPYELAGVVSSRVMTALLGAWSGLVVALMGVTLGQVGTRFPRSQGRADPGRPQNSEAPLPQNAP